MTRVRVPLRGLCLAFAVWAIAACSTDSLTGPRHAAALKADPTVAELMEAHPEYTVCINGRRASREELTHVRVSHIASVEVVKSQSREPPDPSRCWADLVLYHAPPRPTR
jgi:hypothetical protein